MFRKNSYAYHVLDQLGPLSPNGFDCLENVHLAVLDDLLDASVGGTIHSSTATTITGGKNVY